MIFYGKTFSEKINEAKGEKYDEMKRILEAEIRHLKKQLEEKNK